MIEISLYSVPTGSTVDITMGRCVDRARFDREAMGTSIMEFAKGFLKTNVQNFEGALNNAELVNFINSDSVMTTSDFASINYWLCRAGYLVKIFNVTDDEENPTGVSGESAEWNIIDMNFIQHEYPTSIKFIATAGANIIDILKKVVESSRVFDTEKIGVKNPLNELLHNLEAARDLTGGIEPGFASKVYEILSQVGIKIFLATSAD